MSKPEIPAGAYRCRLCWSRCRCHSLPHVECPAADVRDCVGGCGRKTTSTESCHPGFWCRACAHAPGMMNAWRVSAVVELEGGWEEKLYGPMSYSDALELGSKLDAQGARDVHLVESSGSRPRTRPHRRPPPASPDQLDMFKRRRS
jgi:hypothetical protein